MAMKPQKATDNHIKNRAANAEATALKSRKNTPLSPTNSKISPKMMNNVTIGECVEVMQKLPDESIDMIFADPPYNLQLSGATLTRPDETAVTAVLEEWDQFESLNRYDDFTNQWMKQAKRILKPNGALWVIGSYHNIFRLGSVMQNNDFWIINDIIWRKSNPMPNFRGRRFTNAHETLIWAVKSKDAQYTFNYESMKALNDDMQMRSDWTIPICNGGERIKENGHRAHPTQKPESLLARAIIAGSNPDDIILDPFFGSGTTGAVAKKLGRHFIGIERDKTYARIAKTRIEDVEKIGNQELLAMPSKRNAPKVPFGALLESGMIKTGETLICPKRKWRAKVRADGSLLHETGDKTLSGSIHSLSAKLMGRENYNGWIFWSIERENQTIAIDDMRDEIRAQMPK